MDEIEESEVKFLAWVTDGAFMKLIQVSINRFESRDLIRTIKIENSSLFNIIHPY
jgi:hypothetical protein